MLKKISINIILTFITLLFIELIFAIFFITRPNPSISLIFKPFTSYEKINFLSRIEHFDYETNKYKPGLYKTENFEYQINRYGFRGPEINQNDLKTKCVGIAYGGSTTIGLESIYEKTYPKLLENLLNKSGKNCRILNAGVSGKSLKYIFNRIINEVDKFNPEFITIYNNRNSAVYDATTEKIKSDIINDSLNLRLFKIRFFLENNIMTYKFMKKIFLKLNEREYGTPHPLDPKRKINIDYFENGYLNLLEQIYNFVETKKIKLVIIKQIFYVDPIIQKRISLNNISKNIELLEKYHKFDLEKNIIKEISELQKIENYSMITNIILNQQLDRIKKKYSNIIIVDKINDFYKYKSSQMTYDGLHLKEKGNIKIAQGVYEALVDQF